jgi:hypothetical protein
MLVLFEQSQKKEYGWENPKILDRILTGAHKGKKRNKGVCDEY